MAIYEQLSAQPLPGHHRGPGAPFHVLKRPSTPRDAADGPPRPGQHPCPPLTGTTAVGPVSVGTTDWLLVAGPGVPGRRIPERRPLSSSSASVCSLALAVGSTVRGPDPSSPLRHQPGGRAHGRARRLHLALAAANDCRPWANGRRPSDTNCAIPWPRSSTPISWCATPWARRSPRTSIGSLTWPSARRPGPPPWPTT